MEKYIRKIRKKFKKIKNYIRKINKYWKKLKKIKII
jgi:hypothetical protein